MSSITDRHFSVTRTLLGIIGLWPYQTSRLAQFQFFCFSILVTFPAIFQVATFMIISPITTELIIHSCSIFFFYTMSISKYYGVYVNEKTIKYLMKNIRDICDNLNDKNEIAIIERYGNNANRYPVAFLMTLSVGISIYMAALLLPHVFTNVTLSISKPRQRTVLTIINLDNERYSYLVLIYVLLTLCISSYVLIATGTLFILYAHLFCGIFKIASYRVDQAMKIHTARNSLLNNSSTYRSIIYAANLHQKAMAFSKHLVASFDKTFMIMVASSVVSLSLSMFCMFQTLVYKFVFEELAKDAVIIITVLLYLFCANLMGQFVMDHYDYVFATAYTVRWYLAPIYIQKLLLFLLRKGQKAFGLNSMGGFFTASLPCFATLVNASISYFTIMYSMRP